MNITKFRIYHGPINIGGLGRSLADWQRKNGATADFITWYDKTFKQNHHFNLNLYSYGLLSKFIQVIVFFILCLVRYDIFHFYFGISLLPFGLDLPILKILRKRVIMTYCGSEVRLISEEKKRNPYHHLLKIGLDHPKNDLRKKIMLFWHKIWADMIFAPRVLYDTANTIIPSNKLSNLFIHNVMDLNKFPAPSHSINTPPLLVHAPSEKGIKGTKYVIKVIDELLAEGYKFNFRLIHGLPHEDLQKLLHDEADIIIDQFLVGDFGNLAVEGMCHGKTVISYFPEETKNKHCPDCPIVNASIDTLKEKLIWLLNSPDELVKLGKEGRSWVEKHCDYEKINKELWNIYSRL